MPVQERLTLRNIYLYLVCLITLVISIFAAVNLVRGVVEVVYPDPGYFGYAPEQPEAKISEEERRAQEDRAKDAQRRQAVLQLVGSGTTLLITGPLYIYHWRRVQKELPAPPAGPTAPAQPAPL